MIKLRASEQSCAEWFGNPSATPGERTLLLDHRDLCEEVSRLEKENMVLRDQLGAKNFTTLSAKEQGDLCNHVTELETALRELVESAEFAVDYEHMEDSVRLRDSLMKAKALLGLPAQEDKPDELDKCECGHSYSCHANGKACEADTEFDYCHCIKFISVIPAQEGE